MRITSLKVNGFRNLKNIDLTPYDKINVLCGENAQGKTNLMESIWMTSGAKSFRGVKEKDIIGFDSESACVDISFESSVRSENISLTLSRVQRERKIMLNGVKLKSLTELVGRLLCVIFTPEDLFLTKGSPDIRRSYLDLCISQIKPMYAGVAAKYDVLLAQRNAVLKNIAMGISRPDDLEIWDEQIARQGSYISMMRHVYTEVLNRYTTVLYNEISRGREQMSLEYSSTVFEQLSNRTDYKDSMAKEYLAKLRSSLSDDIKLGYTQVGVHRDELTVKIDRKSVRDFGSQGQNRSAALCMKLGQARALYKETNEMPVILLDDVLSELDTSRKQFVLSQINDAQIFITCCEPINGFKEAKKHLFYLKDGRIVSDKG